MLFRRCLLLVFANSVLLAGAAETLRFVWESEHHGKPGYLRGGRVEQSVVPGKGSCTLASKGRPLARIVLAANPTRSAQVAACELQHYVEKITGARLAIVSDAVTPFANYKILVGESALTRKLGLTNDRFEPQEHLIRSYGPMLVLMGCDEQEFGVIDYEGKGLWPEFTHYPEWRRDPQYSRKIGSVYAVDEFLQRCCDVRWFMPGPLGEVCPKRKQLAAVNLDLRRRPWSDYRWYGPQNFRDYFNFIGSGRPDVSYPQRHGQRGWREIGLWMMRMKVIGVEAYNANHSLVGEWFKQRVADQPGAWEEIRAKGHGAAPMQLCLTSDKLLDIVVRDAQDYLGARSNCERAHGRYFPVMAHDTSTGWCTCERCGKVLKAPSAESFDFWNDRASDYMWGLVDRVARRLQTEAPGLWVSNCAYAGYTLAPSFALSDNVACTFCRVLPDYFRLPGYREFAQRWLREWAGRVPRLYVWEYYDHVQSNGWERYFPAVFPHAIAEDVRFLRSIGAKGMFVEMNSLRSCIPNIAQDHLNLYVCLKLLGQDRSEDLDVDGIVDDYCTRFYGPAAEPMRRFFDKLEERGVDPGRHRRDEAVHPHRGREVNDWARSCPPSVLAEFGEMLAEAASLGGESPCRERVELIRQAVYGMMVRNGELFIYGHVRDPGAAGYDFHERPFRVLGDNPGCVLAIEQIDVDEAGNVYTADWSGSEVLKFSPAGDVLLRIPVPGGARCVCLDAAGDIYVAGYRKVLKFRADGTKAFDFANGLSHTVAEGEDVRSLAVDGQGNIWCVVGGKQVRCYNQDGAACEDVRLPDEIELARPAHIKSEHGLLAILDHELRRVYLHDPASQSVDIVQMEEKEKRAFYAGFGVDAQRRVYLGVSNRIKVFEKGEGGFQEVAEHRPDPPYPRDIEFGPDGAVIVATPDRLTRYAADFQPLSVGNGKAAIGADVFEPGRFATPFDVCADGDGALYVCEFGAPRLQKIGPDGAVVWTARTKTKYHCCIAIDRDGAVYLGNMAYPTVAKVSADGEVLWEKGRELFKGSIRGLAVGPDDCLYLSEYANFEGYATRLWKLTRELAPVRSFGVDGCLFLEHDGKRVATANKISVDKEGSIYWVAGPAGIAKLKPDGAPANDFRGGATNVLNLDGSYYWTWYPDKRLDQIADVAVAENGDLLALDGADCRVVRIDPRGRCKGEFGARGYGPGQMRKPGGMCLAGGDKLYVADSGNSRVLEAPLASVRWRAPPAYTLP